MKTRNTLVVLISLLIAIVGTALYIMAKRKGQPVPYHALGMLAYGLVFVGYAAIDAAARHFKKRYRGK